MSVSDIEKEKRKERLSVPKSEQPLCICARPDLCKVQMDSRRCRGKYRCGCGLPGEVEDANGTILCGICAEGQLIIEERCKTNGSH